MRKKVGNIVQFKNFISGLTENEKMSITIDVRNEYGNYLTNEEAEMIFHWLNDIEVNYDVSTVHTSTKTINFMLDDAKVRIWWEKKYTKEEEIAKLKERLEKLEESV